MGLDSGSKLERNFIFPYYSSFIKRYLLVFLIDLPPYEKCHQDRQ